MINKQPRHCIKGNYYSHYCNHHKFNIFNKLNTVYEYLKM